VVTIGMSIDLGFTAKSISYPSGAQVTPTFGPDPPHLQLSPKARNLFVDWVGTGMRNLDAGRDWRPGELMLW